MLVHGVLLVVWLDMILVVLHLCQPYPYYLTDVVSA